MLNLTCSKPLLSYLVIITSCYTSIVSVCQTFIHDFPSFPLFCPQTSLTKFAESLQEMINYHTVGLHCRVKPDVLAVFFSVDSWAMMKFSWCGVAL